MENRAHGIKRWDYNRRCFLPADFPEGWNITCFEDYMNTKCNCAICGQVFEFRNMYTSDSVRNNFDEGYCICRSCMKDECDSDHKLSLMSAPPKKSWSFAMETKKRYERCLQLILMNQNNMIRNLKILPHITLQDRYFTPEGASLSEVGYNITFYYEIKQTSLDGSEIWSKVYEDVDIEFEQDPNWEKKRDDFKQFLNVEISRF